MIENVFMPKGIPLLSDYSLLKLILEYRHASSMLRNHLSPLTSKTYEHIAEALSAIESELNNRGVPFVTEEESAGPEPVGSFSWMNGNVASPLYQS